MSRFRAVIGPLVVGVAIWCAAGDVTIVVDVPSERLVVPAAWWVLAVAVLGAALVPAWRRRPLLASPAVLSTLPWWPVPLPPLAFLWTGPLACLPIVLAVVAALVGIGHESRREEPIAGPPGGRALLAGALTLVVGVAAMWSIAPRVPGGDEPHYLIITQSLLGDGDLQIENNHVDRDYASYFGGELRPDFIERGRNGAIYSIHAPGVSIVVLPAFALLGYQGAQLTVLTLSALAGIVIWLIGWQVTRLSSAAWFAWAAIVGSSTFLLQSGAVFPDAPGALVVATGVWLLVRLADPDDGAPGQSLVVTSALLAALPWLHTRFAVLAVGFGLAVVWALLVADRRQLGRFGRRRLASFLALPVLGALAWFGFFFLVYGTPNPAAPYGSPEASISYVPGGLTALLFDGQFGLLTYTPVLALAVVGLSSSPFPWVRRVAWTSAAIALVYLVAVATYWMWWAGLPATPARFVTAALPLAAVPLAASWARADVAGRTGRLLLLGLSLAVTVVTVGIGRGALAWNGRDAEPAWLEWLSPLVNLPRAWPSFFWQLSPDDLTTQIPFAVHTGTWLAVAAVAALAIAVAMRRCRSAGTRWIVAGWGVTLTLMLLAQTGWWLNRVDGLDPSRSQMTVLRAASHGAPIWRLDSFALSRVPLLTGEPYVRSAEPGRHDVAPPAMVLTDLPGGQYELRLSMERPTSGRLSVSIGRSPEPVHTFAARPVAFQADVLWLPAGARVLTVDADSRLQAAGSRVRLLPVQFTRPADSAAVSFVRYGDAEVYVLGGEPFIEPSGFWVRGGAAAEIVFASQSGVGEVLVTLQNGGVPNQVVIEIEGQATETLTLAPSEARGLRVPLGFRQGTRVRIASTDGFRPSEVGESDDSRFLGVWIEPR